MAGKISLFENVKGGAGPVVLEATPKGASPKPLDLKLVATNGDDRWEGSLKHSQVSTLLAKNASVKEAEWITILTSLFDQEPLSDVVCDATIVQGQSIAITVRKQVHGITQRLGAFTMKREMDELTDVVAWCASAAASASASKAAMAETRQRMQDLDTTVEGLKAQLEELMQAKDDDETALLHKFQDLLNEKKLKIRQQQKILNSESFAAKEAETTSQPAKEEEDDAKETRPKRKPAASRVSKRKATKKTVESDSEDDAFQHMDVDQVKHESEVEEIEPRHSTTASEQATESEDEGEDEDEDDAAPKQTTKSSQRTTAASKTVSEGTGASKKGQAYQPPAPRSLPFAKTKASKIQAAPTASKDDEAETESDDEL